MKNIVTVISSLSNLLPLKPASAAQVDEAEHQLGVKFSDEYKEYLIAFGAIIADGIELTGIAKSEHRNVVSSTRKERELNIKVPLTMYVVENTHVDGIVIWQDANGFVYQSKPDAEPKQIAASLADYISNRSGLQF